MATAARIITMRRSRLVGLLVTAAGVVGVLGASSASAVTAPRTVALHLTVNGSGTLRIPGHPAFVCHAHFPTSAHCRRTFYVRKGRRIVIKESPASGWKLWRWEGACHGTAASCSLRVRARRFGFVTASFLPPGDRLNPYRLGRAAKLTQGWQMKVNSATINADAAVEAVTDQYGNPVNTPPPAGAQYTLVNVSMTYTGAGSRSLPGYLQSGVQAVGAGNAGYNVYGCTPPPLDLNSDFTPVSSGQTVTGNLCFEIASNDAATLMLTAYGSAGLAVWFALH
jgi:hypothetical protein